MPHRPGAGDLPGDPHQHGVALLTTVVAIARMGMLGVTLATLGIVATTPANNDQPATRSYYLAESGLAHARSLLGAGEVADWNVLLQAADGTACSGDELSAEPSNPIPGTGVALGDGRYEVAICDDHAFESTTSDPPDLPDADPNHDANGLVRIVATGFGGDGTKVTVESWISMGRLPPNPGGSEH